MNAPAAPAPQGTFRLFRLLGIDVFLHWSWFLVAAIEIRERNRSYSSPIWNVAEYLALFLIVTLHEFGHSLACRQVGGDANQILLWPFGGIAYVRPPQRPGATLWSLAAGPLVNVALVPVSIVGVLAASALGSRDVHTLIVAVAVINVGLLIFNVLPIYPLDGGQILRSLLWFVMGRGPSLMAAVVVGFVGIAGLALYALAEQSPWLGLMTAYLAMSCFRGFKQAQALAAVAKLPRRRGFSCPSCHASPPQGPLWVCGTCRTNFDTFETATVCPSCGAEHALTSCFDCGARHPLPEWTAAGQLAS